MQSGTPKRECARRKRIVSVVRMFLRLRRNFLISYRVSLSITDVARESGENPEHYQGAVMRSEPQEATAKAGRRDKC